MILSDVTAVIPTVGPPREAMLREAMASVIGQSQPPGQLIVEEDTLHRGGPLTRNAATLKVSTGWVAYLDDDDYWYPTHLEVLWRAAQDTGADVVYPWMTGNDPWPDRFGRAWDSDHPYLFPICYLAKTQVVVDAGAFDHVSLYGHEIVAGEDWPQILRMAGHRPDENGNGTESSRARRSSTTRNGPGITARTPCISPVSRRRSRGASPPGIDHQSLHRVR